MQDGKPEESSERDQQRSKHSHVTEEDRCNQNGCEQERKFGESEPQVPLAIQSLGLVETLQPGGVFGFRRGSFGVGRVWDDRAPGIPVLTLAHAGKGASDCWRGPGLGGPGPCIVFLTRRGAYAMLRGLGPGISGSAAACFERGRAALGFVFGRTAAHRSPTLTPRRLSSSGSGVYSGGPAMRGDVLEARYSLSRGQGRAAPDAMRPGIGRKVWVAPHSCFYCRSSWC